MSNWILIAAGKSLFDAVNAIAPTRNHASDGSVGDLAHVAEGNSDHLPDEDYPALRNKDADHIDEVHAIDVDSDLRTDGLTMEAVVQHILGRCRTGLETRLTYIIYNRRIWEADRGWVERVYTGTPDPHINHAHFSFSYVTVHEADTSSWHLEDIPVALTAADKTWISAEIAAQCKAAVGGFFAMGKQASGTPTSPAGNALLWQGIPDGTVAGAPSTATWTVIRNLGQHLIGVEKAVNDLASRLPAQS